MRVGLVACSKKKKREPCVAEVLYDSPLFRLSLAHALMTCDRVYILSAKHGLVGLKDRLEPYDVTLKKMSHIEHCEWGLRVDEQIDAQGLDRWRGGDEFIVWGGEAYWCLLGTGIYNIRCAWPDGLKGIGGIIRWLKGEIQKCVRTLPVRAAPPGEPKS